MLIQCHKLLIALAVILLLSPAIAITAEVNITQDIESVEVLHEGQIITIRRNQDTDNTVNPQYALTSRKCPPFCIQPMQIAPGVETIGEIELIDYLKKIREGDDSIMVIDSRTPDWVANGTIPGAVNIPWTRLKPEAGADPFSISDILKEKFNVDTSEGLWDFSNAKTLVLFCNGLWCGQSPSNIRSLLDYGYPAHKLKWYRGGMQSWEYLGLTIVR